MIQWALLKNKNQEGEIYEKISTQVIIARLPDFGIYVVGLR